MLVIRKDDDVIVDFKNSFVMTKGEDSVLCVDTDEDKTVRVQNGFFTQVPNTLWAKLKLLFVLIVYIFENTSIRVIRENK